MNTGKFLNYSISMSDDKTQGRYVVTAEHVRGFYVLSYHATIADARAALARYQATDKRRA